MDENSSAERSVIRGIDRSNVISVDVVENAFLDVDAIGENVLDRVDDGRREFCRGEEAVSLVLDVDQNS